MKKLALVIFVCFAVLVQSCGPKATADIDSLYTETDGIKIHYKAYGDSDKAIVFVHGLGCDMKAWDYQVKDLCKDYRLIFIDLPGHGQSDKPETDYTLDFFAKTIKAVIDEQHIDKATFVGHSLGTPICRQFYFNYPEKVSGLCDIDGVYCFYPSDTIFTEAYKASLDDFVGLFEGDEYNHNMIQFVKSLSYVTTPKEVCEYAMDNMPNTPQKITCSILKNLIDKKYWTGQKISVPTLIFCSQNSDLPPDNYDKMGTLYSNMQYFEFNDIGHFIMMENPKLFNNELKLWLEKEVYQQ